MTCASTSRATSRRTSTRRYERCSPQVRPSSTGYPPTTCSSGTWSRSPRSAGVSRAGACPARSACSWASPARTRCPRAAMLFMGFTSSHVHGLAAGNLASYETVPGWTDCTPGSYLAGGTNMHLSHIGIELDRWYELGHADRLHRMFNPRRSESAEVLSPDQCPATSTFEAERDEDVARFGLVGHNEQMQFLSRCSRRPRPPTARS